MRSPEQLMCWKDLTKDPLQMDLSDNQFGTGRELFSLFRQNAASASEGGGVFRFFKWIGWRHDP